MNTEWKSTEGEREGVAAKSNLKTLVEEFEREEKISVKEDTLTREGEMISNNRPVGCNTNDKR